MPRKRTTRCDQSIPYSMNSGKFHTFMKTIHLLAIGALAFSTMACNTKKEEEDAAKMEERSKEDSLQQVINQLRNESNDLNSMKLKVQDIMRQINDAEDRITTATAEESENQVIVENMAFIEQKMKEYRNSLDEMEQLLRNANQLSEKEKKALKADIASFQTQLEEKDREIALLRDELAQRDRVIAEQGEEISNQNAKVNELTEQNAEKERAMIEQDKKLHTAWYVYGTKKELQEQHILEDGKVMRSSQANKNYFTEIDIRVKKTIPLYSKKVKLLSNHPAGSYSLDKDTQDNYTLRITDENSFWSSSRHLVIQVK